MLGVSVLLVALGAFVVPHALGLRGGTDPQFRAPGLAQAEDDLTLYNNAYVRNLSYVGTFQIVMKSGVAVHRPTGFGYHAVQFELIDVGGVVTANKVVELAPQGSVFTLPGGSGWLAISMKWDNGVNTPPGLPAPRADSPGENLALSGCTDGCFNNSEISSMAFNGCWGGFGYNPKMTAWTRCCSKSDTRCRWKVNLTNGKSCLYDFPCSDSSACVTNDGSFTCTQGCSSSSGNGCP